ncbi:hypothetical protein BDF20DRAFT_872925 [Mycotypha africana]|uniref:uncharacterized protein n=1 Tax=Mycotypha africana TaxID=64632 RepID=UPI002301D3B9|nr:uncharacterized protein BDF20DRAFT_872925 [Mycotypha africana]KAI8977101.1 hypothetical protein BDF20DRAFT_872925 [Mycotypha africana]
MNDIKKSQTPFELLSPYTYKAFRGAFKLVTHIFFREIKVTDLHNVPSSGPCIFIVGPHANQFVDGVVFFSVNPRPSYALMAAVSYKKPFIGHVGKILNAIPVVRPQDIVNVGTGCIHYDAINNPYRILGKGTQFLSEIGVRDFVIFGNNYKLHVAKIISDTLLEVSHAIIPGQNSLKDEWAPFKIAPHVDQTTVYEEVHQHLNRHECITVFPEGGSHDRSEMLPLKAGFAIMALGAKATNPSLDIKIVPVGLNYFHPDRFRSRAVVSFGQPISVHSSDAEDYQKGGKDKREAVTRLLDQCDEAFRTVTVNAPDYDTLMVVQTARRLYVPPNRHKKDSKPPSIADVVQLNRHFGLLWAKLKDEPNLKKIEQKVKYYNSLLQLFGIQDHHVEKLNITPQKAAVQLMKQAIQLLIVTGFGAPSFLLNMPLIWITKFISRMKQKQALAGSSVKIAGKDVLATWKVIVTIFAAPMLYGLYGLFYLIYLHRRKPLLSTRAKLFRSMLLWVIQPIVYYFVMRLSDTGMDIYRSIKPLFLALRNPEASKILLSIRQELSKDLNLFINEHAPELELPSHAGNSSPSLSHDFLPNVVAVGSSSNSSITLSTKESLCEAQQNSQIENRIRSDDSKGSKDSHEPKDSNLLIDASIIEADSSDGSIMLNSFATQSFVIPTGYEESHPASTALSSSKEE